MTSTPSSLPPVRDIPNLSTHERAAILDLLFEPSVPLHALSVDLLHSTVFTSYDDLIASVCVQLTDLLDSPSSSDMKWLDSILGAHPRLGEKKVDSAQSRAEQAQLNTGGNDEAAQLKQLNEEYEAKYPSLRYVVFVNGRPRTVVMDDMRRRIKRGDIDAERRDAIKAMCEIAADRARKLAGNSASAV